MKDLQKYIGKHISEYPKDRIDYRPEINKAGIIIDIWKANDHYGPQEVTVWRDNKIIQGGTIVIFRG